MTEKIYLKCIAKEKVFDNGSSVMNIGIKAEDLKLFIEKHTNERGYVNLNIKRRKEVGQNGDTHTISLDTWKKA
jgi:hypothetical protein